MTCGRLLMAQRCVPSVSFAFVLHAFIVTPITGLSANGPESDNVRTSIAGQLAPGIFKEESRPHHRPTQLPTKTNTAMPCGAEGTRATFARVRGELGDGGSEVIGTNNGRMPTDQDSTSGKCNSRFDGTDVLTGARLHMNIDDNDHGKEREIDDICSTHKRGALSTANTDIDLSYGPVAGISSGTLAPEQQQISLLGQMTGVPDSEIQGRNSGALNSHERMVVDGVDGEVHLTLEHDPWEVYDIVAEADPVASWEVLRQAKLSYYTFRYDKREGRRQLGVLPSEVAHIIPESFSTFTLPVIRSDGSRSKVEGVPNVDWTYLFAHTVAVTQELSRRFDALSSKMEVLKAESQNVSLKLVRLMEEQGKEWQPAARLRSLATVAELKRDNVKNKVVFQKMVGQEHRRWLELRHNQTLEVAEMGLKAAMTLAEETRSMVIETLEEEEKGTEALESIEESLRGSTEATLLLLDREVASQSARLSTNRRLSEDLTVVREMAAAERGGEAADILRIRAKGDEARKQTQAMLDETFAVVGTMVSCAVSDPVKLARSLMEILGLVFLSIFVGNIVALTAGALRKRLTKPQLVRETDLPGSPPAVVFAWVARHARALLRLGFGRTRRVILAKFQELSKEREMAQEGGCLRPDAVSREALEGIVLPPDLEHRLCLLATSIRNSHDRGTPLPHVLINGPTGSGKTLLAKRFVEMCGLSTVVVAGGDVGSLGSTASSDLSALMRWIGGGEVSRSGVGGVGLRSRVSRKGAALVMDEAEAALGDRRKGSMSETARSALNAVLLYTGEFRPGFMMILTTSRPQDLDEAVLDRIDEVIRLPTPTLAERTRLARHYFSVYLHHDAPADFLAGESRTENINENGKQPKRTPKPDERDTSRSPTATATTPSEPERGGEANVSSLDMANKSSPPMPGPEVSASPTPAIGASTKSALNTGSAATNIFTRWFLLSFFFCRHQLGAEREGGRKRYPSSSQRRFSHPIRDSKPRAGGGGSKRISSFWRDRTRRGKREGRNCGSHGDVVVRLSEGFKAKAPGLMAMLAVRSEGFYGRDIIRFFSAVQAAVYGSEDCELTEELWVSTESQKLQEFSNKALMTTIATATATPHNANAMPSTENPDQHQTSTVAAMVGRERKIANDYRPPKNAYPDWKANIEADEQHQKVFGDSSCSFPQSPDQALHKHSDSFATTSTPASLKKNGALVTNFGDVTSTFGGVTVWPNAISQFGKIDNTVAPVGRVTPEAEIVRRGHLSPPCDPEITRPEKVSKYPNRERTTALF